MNRSIAIRYPRGGAALWVEGSPGGDVTTLEFFGSAGSAATATVTGAASEALAGTVVSTGAGMALSPSAEAQTAAGDLSGTGLAVATVTGAGATTQTGTVTATGGGAIPVVLSGGGPRRQERPKFLGELFRKPKLRVAAAATLPAAEASAQAGSISAFGAKSVRIALAGAAAALEPKAVKAAGMARVSIKAAVIGARPVVVALHGAAAAVAQNEMKASGLGFSDAELAAILSAYDQAA